MTRTRSMMHDAATLVVLLFLLLVVAANVRCVPPAATAGGIPDWVALLVASGLVFGFVVGARWLAVRRPRCSSPPLDLVDRCRRHGL